MPSEVRGPGRRWLGRRDPIPGPFWPSAGRGESGIRLTDYRKTELCRVLYIIMIKLGFRFIENSSQGGICILFVSYRWVGILLIFYFVWSFIIF